MYNTYFFIIFTIVVVFFLIDTFVDFLNNKSLKTTIPDVVKDIYDEEKYAKQVAYDKEKFRFGLLSSGISFLIIVVFLLFGLFGVLDQFLRGMMENEMLISLVFFGILFVGQTLLGLPFSYYRMFVIEEKYGFNKSTKSLFFTDTLKSLLLSAIIGGILLLVIIWLYRLSPEYFWIGAWGVLSVFSIFMMMFYSTLIVPLFNKQTPLEDGELKSAIFEFAKKNDFQLDNIFVIDGSKRSSKSNAYFSGFGPKKRIVLFDTLIHDLTTQELVAVLAHEIGHYKKKHTSQMLIFSLLQSFGILFLFSLVVGNADIALALGGEVASFHLGIIAFSLLFTPVSFVLGMLGNMLSRKNEYEADTYAKDHYDGKELSEALKKLSQSNLSNLTPHPLYEFLHYSHPSVLKRLDKLK